MINLRPVLFIVGLMLMTLATAMCLPAIADAAVGNPDWQVFLVSAGFTLFVGGLLVLTAQGPVRGLSIRQAFILTTSIWVVIPVFGALPFLFGELNLSYTDAFFEAMSGITTTGATVIVGLDAAPPGLLLWRSILQWLGGIGIIAMAIAVMPFLRVGGMQLFQMESSEKSEKVLPRAIQLVTYIGVIYIFFTIFCASAYWIAGMSGFDAVAHAMTTISTAGFSTHDASIGHFDSGWIDFIGTVGMLMGSMPFVLYLRALRGHPKALWQDEQVRWFLAIVLTVITLIAAYLIATETFEPLMAIRLASFNVVSVITGTGYATADFSAWGSFPLMAFFFIMFVGGCAGSTTCGIKVFRFQVLYATSRTQMLRLLRPHGIFIAYYNGRPIPDSVADSVMGFFFLYALCFVALAVGLGLLGLDFLTACSAAATAISNVGPGLGPELGPAGTFVNMPDPAKWLMAAGMLLGRLELFTVLVLFVPSFWRG